MRSAIEEAGHANIVIVWWRQLKDSDSNYLAWHMFHGASCFTHGDIAEEIDFLLSLDMYVVEVPLFLEE